MEPGDTIVGRFYLEREVAQGGMGRVFRARDMRTGKIVAIKLATGIRDRELNRFLREGALLADVHHPGIVDYVAHGLWQKSGAFLAMAWLEGEDLATMLSSRPLRVPNPKPETTPETKHEAKPVPPASPAEDDAIDREAITIPELHTDITEVTRDFPAMPDSVRGQPLSMAETWALATRLSDALASLHSHGIIHRDIKPSNIFLQDRRVDRAKLLDLGTAIMFDRPSERFTRSGQMIGTPYYMAPEQVRGDTRLTPAVDIWAMGCVLYRCITGIKLFARGNLMQIMASIMVARPQSVAHVRPDIPVDFATLIMRMLTRDPTRRPADGAALVAELSRIRAGFAGELSLTDRGDTRSTSCSDLAGGDSSRDTTSPSHSRHRRHHHNSDNNSDNDGHGQDPTDPATADDSSTNASLDANAALLARALTSSEWRWTAALALLVPAQRPVDLTAIHTCLDKNDKITLYRPHVETDTAQLAQADAQAQADADILPEAQAWTTSLWLVPNTLSANAEQALHLARISQNVRRTFPDIAQVLLSKRVALHPGDTPDQDSWDRVPSSVVAQAKAGTIYLDQALKSLLDTHYVLTPAADSAASAEALGGAYLQTSRPRWCARLVNTEIMPWIGRKSERASLRAIFSECVEESRSHAVLIIAKAGMGKSRLIHETVAEFNRSEDAPLTLCGFGEPIRSTTSLCMMSRTIARRFGLIFGDPPERNAQRIASQLAEFMSEEAIERVLRHFGTRVTAKMQPPDSSPKPAPLPIEQLGADPTPNLRVFQNAIVEWLRAECQRRPVLLLIDDLHWADMTSVEVVGHLLGALEDQPFMVLASARPEVDQVFPRLWSKRSLHRIQLRPLSRRDATALVQQMLGESASAALMNRIADSANGNPFYLEELIRATPERTAEIPATILGVLQARLNSLDDEARRILRAASIFGNEFYLAGVKALLGDGGLFRVEEWLSELTDADFIEAQESSEPPEQYNYRFSHALIREAIYATLTAEDRQLGHTLAATWLGGTETADAAVVASHFLQGDQPRSAIPYLHVAACQALEVADFRGVLRHTGDAVEAGAQGATLAAIRVLQSEASYWLWDLMTCIEVSEEAAQLLHTGSAAWFCVISNSAASHFRNGEHQRGAAQVQRILATRAEPEAEAMRPAALCRGAYQLFMDGHIDTANRFLKDVDHRVDSALVREHPRLAAQIHSTFGFRAKLMGDWSFAFLHLEKAKNIFSTRGDVGNALQEELTLAHQWGEIGNFPRAIADMRAVVDSAQHKHLPGVAAVASLYLGSYIGQNSHKRREARSLLIAGLMGCRANGNKRSEGLALMELAELEYQGGFPARAERLAARAVTLTKSSRLFNAWAIATHARMLSACGFHERAVICARQAIEQMVTVKPIELGLGRVYLAQLTALEASGAHEELTHVAREAISWLDRRAARIQELDWRRSFLLLPEHEDIATFAQRVGVIDVDTAADATADG